MRYCGSTIRSLAACGLAAAALLACGVTAHAQIRTGTGGGSSGFGTSGMGGSTGFGGLGGQGGGSSLGSSNGFGNSGNGTFSFSGGSSFVGSGSQSFSGGGASFSGGGASFSGGGASFSGGGGSFTGGTSGFTGGSGAGGYGLGGGGGFRGGSASTGISSMNPFRSTYGNILATGLPGGSTSTAFGQPLYSNLSPTTTNVLGSGTSGLGGIGGIGGRGGLGGGGGMSNSAGQTGGSYGAFGVPNRNNMVAASPAGPPPAGSVPLGPAVNPAAQLSALPARMQADLRDLVSRADVSPVTSGAVTFGVDAGGTVVLRGTVANAADARAIESLIRFAPGVRAVRNEMTWK